MCSEKAGFMNYAVNLFIHRVPAQYSGEVNHKAVGCNYLIQWGSYQFDQLANYLFRGDIFEERGKNVFQLKNSFPCPTSVSFHWFQFCDMSRETIS
jgi:hypothetical protein